jgi:hypothetical protein
MAGNEVDTKSFCKSFCKAQKTKSSLYEKKKNIGASSHFVALANK